MAPFYIRLCTICGQSVQRRAGYHNLSSSGIRGTRSRTKSCNKKCPCLIPGFRKHRD